jgi:hypothetical protein
MRSLSVGFGDKVFHGRDDLPDGHYGEWEIGTYWPCWRVVSGHKILCGSQDPVESIQELDERLQVLVLGKFVGVSALSEFDIRVDLDNGIHIEFFGITADDDELFHVFGPNRLYVEFSTTNKWKIGRSTAAEVRPGRKDLK